MYWQKLINKLLPDYLSRFALVASAVVFSASAAAVAQISPGELARSHAHLEGITNCTNCHELGQKISSQKCLDCHTLIQSRISQNKGYHASKTVRSKTCIECHKDHLGRDFQMVEWENGKDQFNHDLAGFALEGKHRGLKCESCHKPSRITDRAVLLRKNDGLKPESTFLGISRECVSCHFDEHRGQLGKDCYACHDYSDWMKSGETKFDHGKTRFPLLGKHSLVPCIQCHPLIGEPKKKEDGTLDPDYKKFKITKFDRCNYCHKDPHDGKFGLNCQKCHTPGGWLNVSISGFDHSKTNYPLTGKHLNVNCLKCHQPDRKKQAVYKNMKFQFCSDCHRDVHAGQLSHREDKGKCEACHTTAGFIPSTFTVERHNQESKYRLLGAHDTVACRSCHVKSEPKAFDTRTGIKIESDTATLVLRFKSHSCSSCHKDIHYGQFRDKIEKHDCAVCHTVKQWKETTFDHGKDSRFPLTGKHKTLRCDQCHKLTDEKTEKQRVLYRPLSIFCESCHKDIHEGQLAKHQSATESHPMTYCDDCHTSDSFKPSVFNHNTQSRFSLTGAHRKVECRQCHIQARVLSDTLITLYKPIDTSCASCHADVHEGAFELK